MARIIGCLLLEPIEVCELSLQRGSSHADLEVGSLPRARESAPHAAPSVSGQSETSASGPSSAKAAEAAGFEVPAWAFDQLAVSTGAGRGITSEDRSFTSRFTGQAESARRGAAGKRPFAQRYLAGKPLMEWVVRRASEALQLDEVVVVLPRTSSSETLASQLPAGTRVVQSKQADRLGRLVDALRQVGDDVDEPTEAIQGIVELRLDCPLLDPCLLDRLVNSVRRGGDVQYATFCSAQRQSSGSVPPRSKLAGSQKSTPDAHLEARPSVLHRQLGLFAEYYSVPTLEQVDHELTDRELRSDFGAHVRRHPERYQQRLVQLPEELDQTDLRFSLRHQEDWEHAEQIVEALGDDQLDWQGMIRLLQDQPVMRNRMARLNQSESALG